MSEDKKNVCCPGIEDLFEPQFFKALGDPNRIAILVTLARAQKECTVTEVSPCCSIDFSVVSRHLGILRDAGIVQSERRGKNVFYRARITEIAKRLKTISDLLFEAATQGGTCCDIDGENDD